MKCGGTVQNVTSLKPRGLVGLFLFRPGEPRKPRTDLESDHRKENYEKSINEADPQEQPDHAGQRRSLIPGVGEYIKSF